MIKSFRGKKTKDTERPQDSIIYNTDFSSSTMARIGLSNASSISTQHTINENFDNSIEKRNKEF